MTMTLRDRRSEFQRIDWTFEGYSAAIARQLQACRSNQTFGSEEMREFQTMFRPRTSIVTRHRRKDMTFAWEHLVWRRCGHLRIELPIHGPSFETLIKVVAKSGVFITDIDVESLAVPLVFQPAVIAQKPAVISIIIRTKSRRHEEEFLRTLASFGYRCKRD